MQLIENRGEVSLYKNDVGQIIATYKDKTLTLQGIRYNQPFTFDSDDEGWVPFSADIYDDPYSNENDGNIVFLWRNPEMGENNGPGWEALSYSSSDGSLLGAYDIYGTFYDPQAMYDFDNKYGSDAWPERHIFGLGNTQYTTDKAKIIDSLGTIFGDIYNGIIKESAKTYSLNQEYELGGIKDFDGNPHANIEDISETAKKSYKYQGSIDVNKDGISEAIFTNKITGRWVTAKLNDNQEIDYLDNGKGGSTRVVGIYEDPLIAEGSNNGGFLSDGVTPAPANFGVSNEERYVEVNGETIDRLALNSQVRFQNDLYIDNLSAKHSGDYDSDGVSEVYWKTNDGTAYLRALMHDDGNIRYANYQSKEQMSAYLTSNGYESIISDIV
tara:strand:- start:47 stop:1198 length:1152 start_codon:yes stop_codon:yes gene_type:complete